jgi:hypothetical protein
MEKREHNWTYDEGYEDESGFYSGESDLYCAVCFRWRTHAVKEDGSEAPWYIDDADEPECPGYPE